MRRSAKATNRIDVGRFVSEGRRLLHAPRAIRQRLEDEGLMLVPASLDSAVPRLSDLDATFEGAQDCRRPLYDRIFDRRLIATYLGAIEQFASEFTPPLLGDPASCTEFFWENPQFSHTDAVFYYCLIRWLRPRRIVDIGGGFATLIADAAIRKNGFGEIISIAPNPAPFIERIETVRENIRTPLQQIPLEQLTELMDSADILFTDTTHSVKIGSDCLYLYLVLLPSLKAPLMVHAHDIFLPFGMPTNWASEQHFHGTEQYLLYAYLLNNNNARVVFGSIYATHFMASEAGRLMRNRHSVGGGSLWFQINESGDAGFQPEALFT